MKHWLMALLLGVTLSSVAVAEKKTDEKSVKAYVIARNNYLYCHLPEIWNAKNDKEISNLLDRWANSTDEEDRFRFNQYIRATNNLAEDFFDNATVQEMWTGSGSGISGYLESMSEAEKRQRTIKHKKDCTK